MTEPSTIHRLRVHVLDTEPAVWRRLELPSSYNLAQLHQLIAEWIPWLEGHEHETLIGDVSYGRTRHPGMQDERSATLAAHAPLGSRFAYLYDLGEDWAHDIVVESIHPPEPGVKYPRCVDGEIAGPLEDVGGPEGYDELLMTFQDPDDPDHSQAVELLGEDFSPFEWPEAPQELHPDPQDTVQGPEDLRRCLEHYGSLLMQRVREQVVGMGEASGPPLLAMLRDAEGASTSLWPRAHAARLLGAITYAPALTELVRLYGAEGEHRLLQFQLGLAISEFEAAAVDPVLQAMEGASAEQRAELLGLLDLIQVRDPRVLQLFLEELKSDPFQAAIHLSGYGDESALPPVQLRLQELLGRDEIDEDGALAALNLAGAVEALGGTLSDEDVEVLEALQADFGLDEGEEDEEDEGDEEAEPVRTPEHQKRGRNDPCWCGSGKKYKKCHLAADERGT